MKLSFTLEGKLIGDLGEDLAVKLFGIELVETRSAEGIDGYASENVCSPKIAIEKANPGS